jgi:hypothetical protein
VRAGVAPRRIMKNVENKFHEMIGEVASFKRIFTKILKLGMGVNKFSHKRSTKIIWSREGTMIAILTS